MQRDPLLNAPIPLWKRYILNWSLVTLNSSSAIYTSHPPVAAIPTVPGRRADPCWNFVDAAACSRTFSLQAQTLSPSRSPLLIVTYHIQPAHDRRRKHCSKHRIGDSQSALREVKGLLVQTVERLNERCCVGKEDKEEERLLKRLLKPASLSSVSQRCRMGRQSPRPAGRRRQEVMSP